MGLCRMKAWTEKRSFLLTVTQIPESERWGSLCPKTICWMHYSVFHSVTYPSIDFHWPQMLCFGVVISCKLIGFERQQGGWLDGVVPHPSTPQDCSTSLVVAPAFCNLPSLGSLELVIVTSLAKMTVPTVSALAQGPVAEESWWKRYRKGWCAH